MIQPLLADPLHGGWSQQEELRFSLDGEPMILSRPQPDLANLVLAATRRLLDSRHIEALVEHVTASGVLTERFLYDPGQTIVNHPWQLNVALLQRFLFRYAELVPDFVWSETAFARVFGELETYVDTGQADILVTTVLHNLRLSSESLDLDDDGSLITLGTVDKQRIWARVRRAPAIHLQQPRGWDVALRTPIAWRPAEPSAMTSVLSQVRERHDDVLTGLRLLRAGDVAMSVSFADPVGQGATFAPPGAQLSDLLGTGDVRRGAILSLHPRDECPLMKLIADYRAHKADSKLAFAMRRFRLSYERQFIDDKLVDGWIALESLFGDPTERSDVASRLARVISAQLREDGPDRRRLRGKILGWYDVRSKVVHGNSELTGTSLTKVAQRTDALLREALTCTLANRAIERPRRE